MSLTYLVILFCSLAYPLFRTFGKPLYFSRNFIPLFISISVTSVIFLSWDWYFTKKGVWGFNPEYVSGIFIGPIPLEEILFFFVIPYCCIFIYEVVRYLLEKSLHFFSDKLITAGLLLLFVTTSFWGKNLSYTSWSSSYATIILVIAFLLRRDILPRFFLSYIFVLLPFSIVNGILTGTGLDQPVVWYNDMENSGIRFFTIPVEDFVYCFGLLLTVTLLYEVIKNKFSVKN